MRAIEIVPTFEIHVWERGVNDIETREWSEEFVRVDPGGTWVWNEFTDGGVHYMRGEYTAPNLWVTQANWDDRDAPIGIAGPYYGTSDLWAGQLMMMTEIQMSTRYLPIY